MTKGLFFFGIPPGLSYSAGLALEVGGVLTDLSWLLRTEGFLGRDPAQTQLCGTSGEPRAPYVRREGCEIGKSASCPLCR